MKLPFAHLSQTAVATLAAAISITLSIVLLSGAGRQGQPVPLLPALGGAVNRITADLGSQAQRKVTQPRTTAPPAELHPPVAFTPSVAAPQPVKHAAHRVHRTRAPVARRRTEAPAPKAPAPVRTTPITTQGFTAVPKSVGKGKSHAPGQLKAKARGRSTAPGQLKAKGHGHAQAAKPVTAARAQSHPHGKALGHAKSVGSGKARGHSSEHHQGLPPGQAKKAPVAPAPPPAAAPTHGNGNGNGGGNGHGGGKK